MATHLTPLKSELRVYLNNGTSTTGAVRTVTVKLADLDATTMASATDEQLALIMAISRAAATMFTKSVYMTAVTESSELSN